jgi:hypothetical protein
MLPRTKITRKRAAKAVDKAVLPKVEKQTDNSQMLANLLAMNSIEYYAALKRENGYDPQIIVKNNTQGVPDVSISAVVITLNEETSVTLNVGEAKCLTDYMPYDKIISAPGFLAAMRKKLVLIADNVKEGISDTSAASSTFSRPLDPITRTPVVPAAWIEATLTDHMESGKPDSALLDLLLVSMGTLSPADTSFLLANLHMVLTDPKDPLAQKVIKMLKATGASTD